MTYCKSNCCNKCTRFSDCGGCKKVLGKPFGGKCVAASCVINSGFEAYTKLKESLINEINSLGINGLFVNDLNLLNGFFVNLEYTFDNGAKVKFLKDENVYLGNQIETEGSDRCIGVVADENFVLVSEYGYMGEKPELILYRKR